MKIKFELVNTDKGIEVETFSFEVNNFEEFKKQIEICTLSNKFWGGEEIAEEIEGFETIDNTAKINFVKEAKENA